MEYGPVLIDARLRSPDSLPMNPASSLALSPFLMIGQSNEVRVNLISLVFRTAVSHGSRRSVECASVIYSLWNLMSLPSGILQCRSRAEV